MSSKLTVVKNAAELRDQFLRDIRLAAIDAGVTAPPVTPGTDWFMLATAVANVGLIAQANIAISDSEISIFTASTERLAQLRSEYGLPEVQKSGASGRVTISVSGAATIPSGTQLLLPNGFRIQVVGTYVSPTDGQEIDVTAVDLGSASNTVAGTPVRFISAPFNILEVATVSIGAPLTGGIDTETEDRLRKRILNVTQNRPAGGNWAHVREVALNSSGAVQDCFIYPGLGGPGSSQAVPVKMYDRPNLNFSRAMNAAQLNTVRGAIQSQFGLDTEHVIRAAADERVDVALSMSLPASALAGGTGLGWLDPTPWPTPTGADLGRCQVSVYTGVTLTTSAATTTTPAALQTKIAWWSPNDMRFYQGLVISYTGGTGAWELILDKPLADSTGAAPAVGDYICPAAKSLSLYGDAWLDLLENLGPGENTADINRLPRSLRKPLVTDAAPSSVNAAALSRFTDKFSEINSTAVSYSSQTVPTTPVIVSASPNVLSPRKFAVYPA